MAETPDNGKNVPSGGLSEGFSMNPGSTTSRESVSSGERHQKGWESPQTATSWEQTHQITPAHSQPLCGLPGPPGEDQNPLAISPRFTEAPTVGSSSCI